jgi:hypothetical protein
MDRCPLTDASSCDGWICVEYEEVVLEVGKCCDLAFHISYSASVKVENKLVASFGEG